jgi:hypothetical protein
MGAEIEKSDFTAAEYAAFKARLPDQLAALELLIARPGFGMAPRSIGAELELFLVDGAGGPVPIAAEVKDRLASPNVSLELGRFEIELCTAPVLLEGRPFAALERDIGRERDAIEAAARELGAQTVAVSILPTLQRRDLTAASITATPRYDALTAGMRRLRQAPFQIDIDGDEPLEVMSDDAAMEGANTAFQIHLLATPGEFAAVFNAALLASAPALAAAGNSPTFLGHGLWEETRVALFKQAGDVRPPDPSQAFRPPARISFGTGWMRDGAVEQFRESVALHEPLLPVLADGGENALAEAQAGGTPALSELRMHHGTVWHWNRAVYDPAGHLRIELRALPAGPTTADMLANAAFLIGLTLDLVSDVDVLLPGMPFAYAERNFYRAAQQGLAAELLWPRQSAAPPVPVRAEVLLPELITRARRGLAAAGVDPAEIGQHLDVFAARVASGITGAVWQRRCLAAIEAAQVAAGGALDRQLALAQMVERYLFRAAAGDPVHTWPIEAP